MYSNTLKQARRERRKQRIRKRVFGTAARPRLSVFRSLKNVYAQIIDDERGVTLCAAGTRGKDLSGQVGYGGNRKAATLVGANLAQKALALGVEQVCFDRNGYRFHGRIKALAEALVAGGVQLMRPDRLAAKAEEAAREAAAKEAAQKQAESGAAGGKKKKKEKKQAEEPAGE